MLVLTINFTDYEFFVSSWFRTKLIVIGMFTNLRVLAKGVRGLWILIEICHLILRLFVLHDSIVIVVN